MPTPLRRHITRLASWTLATALGSAAAAPAWGNAVAPTAERQAQLIHMVRQDCGSCHGLYLTGGLGPALTRDALAERSLDSLIATTLHGRPGTAMPGWKAMLSEADAHWIAQQLLRGFPTEKNK